MTRRRTWSPPRSAHLSVRPPSLAQTPPPDAVAAAAPFAWGRNPSGHLAVNRPICTVVRCTESAMTWSRCGKGCRAVIARCHIHNSTDPMLAARAAHEVAHG